MSEILDTVWKFGHSNFFVSLKCNHSARFTHQIWVSGWCPGQSGNPGRPRFSGERNASRKKTRCWKPRRWSGRRGASAERGRVGGWGGASLRLILKRLILFAGAWGAVPWPASGPPGPGPPPRTCNTDTPGQPSVGHRTYGRNFLLCCETSAKKRNQKSPSAILAVIFLFVNLIVYFVSLRMYLYANEKKVLRKIYAWLLF